MSEIRELDEDELESISGGKGENKAGKKKKYFCQYCTKSYEKESDLKKHIKSAHPGEPVIY